MTIEEIFSNIPKDKALELISNPLKWAEAFLVTPNTSEPFKANHIESLILSSTHRFNVIRVHRRGGKSWALSTLAIYYAMTQRNTEILVICPDGSKVATIFDRIREFVAANDWIHPYRNEDRQNLPQKISFTNGSKITGFTTAAKSKGEALGLRSQGADIVLIDEAAYLGDGDWTAINPIITGDMYRRNKTRVFVASTPAHTRGRYYEMCKNPRMKKAWHEIFVPIDKNPSVTPEFYAECVVMCPNEMDWNKEYLAEFPELGEGVFPKTLVDKSLRSYSYKDFLTLAEAQGQRGEKPPSRTIGVDWDKYNKDGHGSTIAILESIDPGRYRLIYKEEIDQSRFTLSNAVRRVIELNDLFQPEWIYIDRGYGDYQLEELHKYGRSFPKTGLFHKVVGVQFANSVECPLPGGGVEKKRFKQAMVSLLRTWFERENIELPGDDHMLVKDLIEYHVKSQTEANIKYSEENDHSIAAIGLAAMAMHHRVKNPYASPPATRTYSVAAPVAIPSATMQARYNKSYRRSPLIGDPEPFNNTFPGDSGYNRETTSFHRGTLGSSLPKERPTF